VSVRPDVAAADGVRDARRDRVATALNLLPGTLAALSEGAWVSVVAAVVAAAAHETSQLGPAGFAVAAIAGLVAARVLGSRPDWPVLTLALTVGAAVVGWLADPFARSALVSLDLGGAVAHHPAGWLAGLAFLRGSAHARLSSSHGAMETLLALALPGLAIPVLVGGILDQPWRAQFLGDAQVGVVLFLVAGTVGVGVARLSALRGPAGFDWRGNRAWLLLIVVLVLGVSLIALPLATIVGPAVQIAIAALFLPAIVLGTIVGLRQVSARAIVAYLVLCGALIVALSLFGNAKVQPVATPEGAGTSGEATSDPTIAYAVLGIGLLALFVVAVLLLARLWSRDALSRRGGDVPEERWIDLGVASGEKTRTRRPWRRPRRRATPTGAVEAYLAALDALEPRADLRRRPDESPAQHAERLRATGAGDLALDLLAADYELVRFGSVRMSAAEDRRAIARWRRIRRLDRVRPSV
jgi:Domain of unknown function (DUF4129)